MDDLQRRLREADPLSVATESIPDAPRLDAIKGRILTIGERPERTRVRFARLGLTGLGSATLAAVLMVSSLARPSAQVLAWSPDPVPATDAQKAAAAVTCAIMKPELRPGLRMRKGGSSEIDESISAAMRRSESEPTSHTANARWSAAKATGSAWKLPPERTSPSAGKISGLSVTALASRTRTVAVCRMTSRHAPITCGWQRSEYGSCTRSSPSAMTRITGSVPDGRITSRPLLPRRVSPAAMARLTVSPASGLPPL